MGTEDYLHFINREEELQTITDSVIALSNGSYDGLGVRFFEYVGIGKSVV